MKSKILFLCVLILGVSVAPNLVLAEEPAIIKDIVVDTVDSSVKISITSSQTLQIETFKNDESPANYIVLDFLGTVYTKLPSMIKVGQGPVEKVSLVPGEDRKIQVLGEDYYSLDFLAINLNKAADYRINQSKSVIDLSIGTVAGLQASAEKSSNEKDLYTSQKAVELTPPIVVSKQKGREQEAVNEKFDYKAYASERSKTDSTLKAYSSSSGSSTQTKKRRRRKATSEEKKTTKQISDSGRKARRVKVETATKEDLPKAVEVRKEKPKTYQPPIRSAQSNELIDQIVSETIREKERTISKIQDLTYELKRMQDELYLSKGQKSKLEDKINEILAKLDQLKEALDEEIRRRQMLGEAVEDLIAKRDAYTKAKKLYEELGAKLAQVTDAVDDMNSETQIMRTRVNELQVEKEKLTTEVNSMEKEYNQLKTDYDKAINSQESVSIQIDKIAREIEKLRAELNRKVEERAQVAMAVKELENRNKYNGVELARLRQLLVDKEASLSELEARYARLKAELDSAVSEKLKLDYSYRNAKTEFERIKREIESYLNDKKK